MLCGDGIISFLKQNKAPLVRAGSWFCTWVALKSHVTFGSSMKVFIFFRIARY
jgi:hypothetical protein